MQSQPSPSSRKREATERDVVIDRWRSAAHLSGWRAAGDWFDPAVVEMTTTAMLGGDPSCAAASLGAARARAGIGIDEGLDDLERLWPLVGVTRTPAAAIRSFAAAWADASAAPASRPAFDPLTGLVTPDLLRVRITDLHRTGGALGAAIVVVDAVEAGAPRFARGLQVASVATLLLESFAGAESPARLPGDRVAAIVPRDGALDEGVVRLRRAIDRLQHPTRPGGAQVTDRVLVSAIPDAPAALTALLSNG